MTPTSLRQPDLVRGDQGRSHAVSEGPETILRTRDNPALVMDNSRHVLYEYSFGLKYLGRADDAHVERVSGVVPS